MFLPSFLSKTHVIYDVFSRIFKCRFWRKKNVKQKWMVGWRPFYYSKICCCENFENYRMSHCIKMIQCRGFITSLGCHKCCWCQCSILFVIEVIIACLSEVVPGHLRIQFLNNIKYSIGGFRGGGGSGGRTPRLSLGHKIVFENV